MGNRLTQCLAFCLTAAVLACACAPSINPAMKASVDAQLADASPGERSFEAPAEPVRLELSEGQWIKLKAVDDKGQPSIMTYKVLGQEGDAQWIEFGYESYYERRINKMLVKIDPADPSKTEIRRARMKIDDDEPVDFDGPALKLTQALYKKMIASLTTQWPPGEKKDVTVPAGTFAQCYKVDSEMSFGPFATASTGYVHPAVPINGLVTSSSEDTKIELLDFGMEGAEPSF